MQAWVIAMPKPMLMVICSWNVPDSLLSRFPCFIRSHLPEYSYHPVILSLLCPLSLIPLLSLPSSFFFYHSFFIALSVPSILLPTRLHLFFLTSLSFLPVFQPWFFPPSFTVTLSLSLSPASSLSLSVPSFSSLSVYPVASLWRPIHINISLPFPLPLLLFLEYVIFHTSWRHPSLTDPVSTRFPTISFSFPSVPLVFGKTDNNQPVWLSWSLTGF